LDPSTKKEMTKKKKRKKKKCHHEMQGSVLFLSIWGGVPSAPSMVEGAILQRHCGVIGDYLKSVKVMPCS
jgi:hypothetical protein